MSLDKHAIPYQEDPGVWLTALADEPYPLMLDSNDSLGRYHIITASPSQWIVLNGTRLSAFGEDVDQFTQSSATPDICWQAVAALRQSSGYTRSDLPFPGGIAGFLGYEFGVWEHLDIAPEPEAIAPALWVGKYDWALIADITQATAYLVFDDTVNPCVKERIKTALDKAGVTPPCTQHGDTATLSPEVSRPRYEGAIDSIKAYIAQGDCYQINFTQRFRGACPPGLEGSSLYRAIRSRQSAPFGAYLGLPDNNQILSFSPERLVSCSPTGSVLAQPIKGTMRRSTTPEEDRQLALALMDSDKDRAENLMIVDLLRNDLSKVCEPHSVTVPHLFELQSFSTVHHLVSSIQGQLLQNREPLDLLRACFPGGSITGAPKRRAMQIIQELESHGRSVYCGSFFYLGRNDQLDANIAIRTLVRHRNTLYCWGGGGITIGSRADAEYQESLDKIARLTNYHE